MRRAASAAVPLAGPSESESSALLTESLATSAAQKRWRRYCPMAASAAAREQEAPHVIDVDPVVCAEELHAQPLPGAALRDDAVREVAVADAQPSPAARSGEVDGPWTTVKLNESTNERAANSIGRGLPSCTSITIVPAVKCGCRADGRGARQGGEVLSGAVQARRLVERFVEKHRSEQRRAVGRGEALRGAGREVRRLHDVLKLAAVNLQWLSHVRKRWSPETRTSVPPLISPVAGDTDETRCLG